MGKAELVKAELVKAEPVTNPSKSPFVQPQIGIGNFEKMATKK